MSLITTTINLPDNPIGRGYQLSLPDKDSRLTDCLRRFELPDVSTERNCLMQNVNVLGEPFSMLEGTLCNLDELNYLAKRLDSLDKKEWRPFLAAAEATRADDIAKLINLTFNLHCYSLVDNFNDMEKLGEQLYLNEHILPHIDFEGYARERQAQIPGQFTEYGLLNYVGSSSEIAQIAKLPFQQPSYSTLRLFSPICCDLFEKGEYGLAEYPDRLNAAESASYQDSIAEMVEACNRRDGNRGLAPYLDRGSLADKVYSMIPTVEEYGGRLFGVLECQLREPLTGQEYTDLCSQWEGQESDGYGEGLEQQEIKVADGVINVHLWESDRNWSIQTEAQLKGEPELDFSMRMQMGEM